MYRVMQAVITIALPVQVRLHVMGKEVVPTAGPALLVSNHLGLIDPLAIAVRLRRKLRILAKAELFEWPVIGGLARLSGVVPIRRGERDLVAFAALEDVLYQGHCVLIFPEGTYPKPPLPAALLPFKTGAVWLAVQTHVPIVPVAVWGSERVWAPRRGWQPWPWQRPDVWVRFGESYYPQPTVSLARAEARQAVADEMACRICDLLPERYHGAYTKATLPADSR